jgi:hypothetical protein
LAFWLTVTLLPGIVGGCATLPEGQAKAPLASTTGRALFDEWLTSRAQNHTLQGVAKLRVETPERTVNGTQVLLAEEPERLRAETLSPFGTPLLVVTANETEFAVLAPGDNRFYQGRPTAENLGRFIRLPLRLVDLVSILLGRPPLIAYDRFETSQSPDGGWLVALESGQRRQELLFDGAHRLAGVRYLSAAELQLRLAYGEFADDPRGLPRRIDLELPRQQIQAALVFKELEMNRPLRPEVFTLVAPPGATVTFLDEPAASRFPLPPESK